MKRKKPARVEVWTTNDPRNAIWFIGNESRWLHDGITDVWCSGRLVLNNEWQELRGKPRADAIRKLKAALKKKNPRNK